MKLVTVAQMRQLEAEADARGVSYAQMMETAGAAVAATILERQLPADTAVVVLVGPGNNGGDGLVAARYLAEAGVVVKIFALKSVDETDTKVQALRELGIFMADAEHDPHYHALRQMLKEPTNVIVDALLGTGLKLPLRENAQNLLAYVKAHYTPAQQWVLAVDAPSGMDCDSGEVDEAVTLPAQITVTFGLAKVGQFKFPAANYLGELLVAPIGWPINLPTLQTPLVELATRELVQNYLPLRPRNAHKYTFGKLLAIVGSKNYVGAAHLVGRAANRIGTGLVTLAVPQSIYPILASQLIESTWLPQPDDWSEIESLRAAVSKYEAVVLGCGLGLAAATQNFVAKFFEAYGSVPLLIDADGLRLLAQIENWWQKIPPLSVLTPHPGEMSALTGLSVAAIQKDRVGVAQKFARVWGQVVLLKGAFTVIAAPDGRTAVQPFAEAALAKAGSGDVLAGLVGGLLAQKVAPWEAATLGAFVHGRAGELASQNIGTSISVVASDLLDALPESLQELK